MREAGFSVVEVLAALFVLSLALVAVGGVVSNVATLWSKTEGHLDETEAMTVLAERVIDGFDEEGGAEGVPPVLSFDDGTRLSFERELVLTDADCAFDTIGRRCR